MTRPRVLISALAGVQGGPRTYAVSLARRLPAAAPDLDFVWLSETPPESLGMPVETVSLPHPLLRPLWDHVAVPRAIRRLRADLHHNTKNALPLARSGRSVVTIHDLAPFRTPATFSPLSRLYLEFHIRHAARVADAVIAVSESTRRDLLEILGISPSRVHVVPNGVDESFFAAPTARSAEVRARYGLGRPYVLFAGTLQPRKNPDVVLRAHLALPEELRGELTLVFAGRLGWRIGGFADRVEAARATADVRLLTDVPDRDLPDLFASALVFVSPSSYEGFGLTVLEAMAAGTPVIAGARSSVPEVVGDAGLLVEPESEAEVRAALHDILTNDDLRRRLAEEGNRRARRFTWERTAALTAEVYRAVLTAGA